MSYIVKHLHFLERERGREKEHILKADKILKCPLIPDFKQFRNQNAKNVYKKYRSMISLKFLFFEVIDE